VNFAERVSSTGDGFSLGRGVPPVIAKVLFLAYSFAFPMKVYPGCTHHMAVYVSAVPSPSSRSPHVTAKQTSDVQISRLFDPSVFHHPSSISRQFVAVVLLLAWYNLAMHYSWDWDCPSRSCQDVRRHAITQTPEFAVWS
jgi:hypothetical protein